MTTCAMLQLTLYEQEELQKLMSSPEDSPAKTSVWQDAARGWLESGQDSGTSSTALFVRLGQLGLLSKTSPVYYPATKEEILPPSFRGWSNAGMASAGGYLTLSLPEWPKDAAACGLSEVLEADVPPKYFLSAKACAGILRRATARDRKIPSRLQSALEAQAGILSGKTTAPTPLLTPEPEAERKIA